jgi:hypothetical protein
MLIFMKNWGWGRIEDKNEQLGFKNEKMKV